MQFSASPWPVRQVGIVENTLFRVPVPPLHEVGYDPHSEGAAAAGPLAPAVIEDMFRSAGAGPWARQAFSPGVSRRGLSGIGSNTATA